MASMVAKNRSGSSISGGSQVSSTVSVQEKGSRNKRKFRADPPLGDLGKGMSSNQHECVSYEFSAEKYEISSGHEHIQTGGCDFCCVSQDHSDALKLNLGLPNMLGLPSEVVTSCPREEVEADEMQNAAWNDLTESQLEELILSNLDVIIKTAIKKIVACGYSEEVVTKAILRSSLYYGGKDTESNIVDNTLTILKNGQEVDFLRDHCFEDLQQLGKFILAEMVCVLRELRPSFSTGDAMWCLLISDLNVSNACVIDGDPSCNVATVATDSSSTWTQLKTEAKRSDPSPPGPNISTPSKIPSSFSSVQGSQSDINTTHGVPYLAKPKISPVLNGLVSASDPVTSQPPGDKSQPSIDKPLGVAGTSQPPAPEEKVGGSRKVHTSSAKRESVLRQKSIHLEKNYRTYGTKGSSRSGKLNGFSGLILDKKLKSVSGSACVDLKNASLRISRAMGVDVPEDGGTPSSGISSSPPSNLENIRSNPSTLSAADTELSLSLPTKSNSVPMPLSCVTETMNTVPFDKSLPQWVPQAPHDKKDEMIMKLVPRVGDLQSQLQKWTEWANQKVMQAARRLSKDKAELKTLRQEKEEVERLKKEKQALEENTMKKLAEMENALSKASGQVDRANSAVRRLEVENAGLRQEMEVAKLRAAESAASCQEVSKRERKTLIKFQTWERQKSLFQEELVTEKRKLAQLLQELEQAKDQLEQLEARWKQEEKAKEELLMQAGSIRKEREQIETSAKSKEDMIKMKAENNMKRYKDDIQKLETEISQLRLKSDSSKIAALRMGIDGSYASRLADPKTAGPTKDLRDLNVSEMITDFMSGGVKRDRECVMCLSEEMSVVFLPCAHQVVCTMCNERHEKQGMKDCPSCRSIIQRRISVRYARSS